MVNAHLIYDGLRKESFPDLAEFDLAEFSAKVAESLCDDGVSSVGTSPNKRSRQSSSPPAEPERMPEREPCQLVTLASVCECCYVVHCS